MKILDIYTRYQIPPNLIRHQLEVTAVGEYVCEHWTPRRHDSGYEGQDGPKIDRKLITEVLLLHDMGNIIKFKRPFMGELEEKATYWEQVQEQFIQKYGKDVDAATAAIVGELGLSSVKTLLEEMKATWSDPKRQVSWEARICEFADCCVTPKGIEGFETRMQDLWNRYHQHIDDPTLGRMRENARKLEVYVTIDMYDFTGIDFSKKVEELKKYSF